MSLPLDRRPVVVALAGPNGAGKTTFYHAHLQAAGLRLVNADVLARELGVDAYTAADMAEALRRRLASQSESFVFETVFSDPVGDKIAFLDELDKSGYNVILCFIGIASVKTSEERVAMRVSQGGHDVPTSKLRSRFPRTMSNLKASIQKLPRVFIFDNEDISKPFRKIAEFQNGKAIMLAKPVPSWLKKITDAKKS